ncbi:MAG: hypothetical protein WBI12_12115, partial [Methanosarcina flavescens]
DKPARVPDCTEVREPSGTLDRCHAHPIILIFSKNGFFKTDFLIVILYLFDVDPSYRLYYPPERGA